MKKIKKIFREVATLSFGLSLALIVGVGFTVAWGYTNMPTEAPPGGNLGAPINTSDNPQTKSGILTLGGLTSIGQSIFQDLVYFWKDVSFNKNVSIGPGFGSVDMTGKTSGYLSVEDIYINSVDKWASEIVPYSPGTQTFSSSGFFTVPAGVHSITVDVWGGGGGGAGGRCTTQYEGEVLCVDGGGGAAGGYARSVITVNPGDKFYAAIGSGGCSGTIVSVANYGTHPYYYRGCTGWSSELYDANWNALIVATGGQGGQDISHYCDGGSCNGWADCSKNAYTPVGGVGTKGTLFNVTGGDGSACGGYNNRGGDAPGYAPLSNGGVGGDAATVGGFPGGGGGGGLAYTFSISPGGLGGNGAIKITW